jgi:hypothetical protein
MKIKESDSGGVQYSSSTLRNKEYSAKFSDQTLIYLQCLSTNEN